MCFSGLQPVFARFLLIVDSGLKLTMLHYKLRNPVIDRYESFARIRDFLCSSISVAVGRCVCYAAVFRNDMITSGVSYQQHKFAEIVLGCIACTQCIDAAYCYKCRT